MTTTVSQPSDPYHAIKRHSAWLLAAFFLALAYYSGNNLWHSLSDLRNAKQVSILTESSVVMSAAVHELQRERGLSSGFLASEGKRFDDALTTQRGKTELMLQKIAPALEARRLDARQWGLGSIENRNIIEKTRQEVSAMTISRDDAVARYTQLIDRLFAVMSSEAQVSGALLRPQLAFIAFLQAKEMAGQERAMLTAILSTGNFSDMVRVKALHRIQAVRDTRLDQFLASTDATTRTHHAEMQSKPLFIEAARIRQKVSVLEQGTSLPQSDLPTAESWFETSTHVIDAMKAMEDGLSASILRDANNAEVTSRWQLLINGLSALASFIFAGLLIWQVRRGKLHAETTLRLAGKAFSNSVEAIVVTNTNSIVIEVNPAFSRITGYTRDEVLGKHVRLLKSGRHDSEFYTNMWQRLAAEGNWEGEVWNRRKNGDIYPAFLSIVAVKDNLDQLVNYIAMTVDLSQHKKTESLLEQLRTFDALTGLLSRDAWMSALDRALANARDTPRRFAVLEVGLDRFKLINDSLSHAVGDLVLVEAADRLRSELRRHDAAARTNGDRYAILLEDIDESQNAGTICEKLLAAFIPPFEISGHTLHISASIGIALFPEDGDAPGPLLRNSETAMYRAKKDGLGTYQFYSTEMNAEGTRLLALETMLRQALSRNEFALHYQPQVDVDSGHLVGVEALIRWNNPQLGMVSPIQFIPMAEETGLIVPIGDWVLQTACAEAKRWLDLLGVGIPVAVNLSARQFRKLDLLASIQLVLDKAGLPNHLLEIEITEGSLIVDPSGAVDVLRGIREMGVRTAIDDFGTGYSSLAYLKTFPLDRLKIDRAFIRDLPDNSSDVAIARAIVALGRNLNMEVLAEGVETQAQSDFLAATGCDVIQGYFYGKPMPAEQLLQQIQSGKLTLPGKNDNKENHT